MERPSRPAAVLLVLLVGALLAGCSVPGDGWVGVGRAQDGSLHVYVWTCHQPVGGVTLYWPDDPNGANPNEEVFAEWSIAASAPGPLRTDWPLLGPGSGVASIDRPIRKLPGPPKDMAVYAWTHDNSTSAAGPNPFTTDAVQRLEAGQILIADDAGDEHAPPNRTISLADFDALDCSEFG